MKKTLLFLALLFLPSCSAQEKTNVLRLMIWGDAAELESVRSFVQGFEKIHPELKVNIFCINPTDYNQRLQALYLNRQSPDVMYASRTWFRFYAARGMFKDLKPFIDADKEFDFNDFYPEVRNSFFFQEHPYAIAKDFTPMVLYYNLDLFKKAGLALPNKKWTWENFLSAAKTLTIDEDRDGKPEQYGFVVDPWFDWVLPWIWQAGGEVLDESETQSMVGSPSRMENNVRALQFLYDLIYKYKVAPEPKTTDLLGSSALFLSGRAAMCAYGRWMCLNFKQIKDFKWNVAPLPREKNSSTVLLTVGYAISSRSKQPNAAWQLIKYLTGMEGQSQVADSGLAVPSRRSVAQSAHFLRAVSLPQTLNHRTFLESLEGIRFPPSPAEWPQMEEEIKTALNLIFRQKKSVRDSLLNLHKKFETIFRTK